MKTTIYELLGMVKDGKELPKKVKYDGVIFENKDGDLLNDINCSLFEHRGNEYEKLLPMLNDEVEILEEKKIPEKLNYKKEYMSSSNGFLLQYCIDFATKIDEIIDYFEYLKKTKEINND